MNRTLRHSRFVWLVPLMAAALLGVGLLAMSRGDELAASGAFARRQAVWGLLSVVALFATTLVSYRRLRRWSYPLYAVSLVLLVAVYLFPAKYHSHRWIPLGIADFQPSELAKLAYILTLSFYLRHRRNYRNLSGLLLPFTITAVPVVLILREPDLGTSLLFFPVLYAMLFAAGARLRHLVAIGLLGVAMLPVLWKVMSAEQRSRITAVFTQADGGLAPTGDGYHLHQSKQMLALGGLWGSEITGMPVSDAAAYRLYASRTDFIYCLVGERYGTWGGAGALLLYAGLLGSCLVVAGSTQEPFGRLLCVGIAALLAAQVIINTGMTVGLMPITGLTLPLLSYGGSSLLTTGVSLGLVLNVGLRPGFEVGGEPFRFGGRQVAAAA